MVRDGKMKNSEKFWNHELASHPPSRMACFNFGSGFSTYPPVNCKSRCTLRTLWWEATRSFCVLKRRQSPIDGSSLHPEIYDSGKIPVLHNLPPPTAPFNPPSSLARWITLNMGGTKRVSFQELTVSWKTEEFPEVLGAFGQETLTYGDKFKKIRCKNRRSPHQRT